MIAGIHEDEWDDRTVAEHANVIVAAPELLAACEAVLAATGTIETEAAYRQVEAAIAKASVPPAETAPAP